MRRRKRKPPDETRQAINAQTVAAIGGLYASGVPDDAERRRVAAQVLSETREALVSLQDAWEEFSLAHREARTASRWVWNSDGALLSFEDACEIVNRDADVLREKLYEGLSDDVVRIAMAGMCPICRKMPTRE